MIFKLLLAACLCLGTAFNSVYDYSVPLIEGNSISVSEFSNKRILIITLPIVQDASADSLLYSLDTIAANHFDSLQVIAVPAYEDGYNIDIKSTLLQWYRSKLDNRIIITEGLYCRKSSTQQHGLFHWLTHVEANGNFDNGITGPGHKFFIRPGGILYGNLAPHTRMWSKAVNKTINLP